MKALLISDIHSSYRLLSMLCEKFKDDKELKCIIFAGDVVDMGEPVSFVDEFLWTVEQLECKLIWVPGNNDFGRAYHRLNARIKSLEGQVLEFSGKRFTGVGGSPASWSGQYEGAQAVEKTAIGGTIFVSHVPPPGLANFQKFDQANPKNQETITKQIKNNNLQMSNKIPDEEIKNTLKLDIRNSNFSKPLSLADAPLVHICGHIHHTWGVGYLGSTKVIKLAAAYLGYYAIMDLETLRVDFGRLWK